MREESVAAPPAQDSTAGANTRRILDAIHGLPEDEGEVFSLVRIQGLTHAEAAGILGVTTKTVQRRLNRGLMLLAEALGDLRTDRGATQDA
jgi:RNA polymerase sigma-70 factor (ECF subfamily)